MPDARRSARAAKEAVGFEAAGPDGNRSRLNGSSQTVQQITTSLRTGSGQRPANRGSPSSALKKMRWQGIKTSIAPEEESDAPVTGLNPETKGRGGEYIPGVERRREVAAVDDPRGTLSRWAGQAGPCIVVARRSTHAEGHVLRWSRSYPKRAPDVGESWHGGPRQQAGQSQTQGAEKKSESDRTRRRRCGRCGAGVAAKEAHQENQKKVARAPGKKLRQRAW